MTFMMSHFSSSIVVIGFVQPLNTISDVVRDSREIEKQIADFLGNTDTTIWCIYDFSDVEMPFDHLMMLFTDQNRKKNGSFSDPRVQVVGVVYGQATTQKLNDFLSRSKIEMPLFGWFDDALAYVYDQIGVDTLLNQLNF